MENQICTVSEVGKMLRVRPGTIRKWIYEGKLPHLKLGGRVLIREKDIDDFIDRNYHPAREERNNGNKN